MITDSYTHCIQYLMTNTSQQAENPNDLLYLYEYAASQDLITYLTLSTKSFQNLGKSCKL
ncbi:unnamed protein product [Moneuplotes crassus]|uniref:Uncharacterized protein n=1 Tax=Euplotes crassus TaxID=5936 RepID=A0AAD1XHY3_EUPCR|nr:unnamed protein product [Moneuplotes crassus]